MQSDTLKTVTDKVAVHTHTHLNPGIILAKPMTFWMLYETRSARWGSIEKLEPSSSLESGLLPCSWYIISRLLKFILVSTVSAVSKMKTEEQRGSKKESRKKDKKNLSQPDPTTVSNYSSINRNTVL